jgi:hypothetical protein
MDIENPAGEAGTEDTSAGTVDWASAERLLSGKPPVDASAEAVETGTDPEPAPELREFRYKGRVLQVAPEQHELMTELLREARSANGRLGSERQALLERLDKLETRLSANQEVHAALSAPPKPDPQLALSDFPAWQGQMDRYNEWLVEQKTTSLRNEYNAAKEAEAAEAAAHAQAKAWATGFYSAHSHLDNEALRPIVREVWSEVSPQFAGLDTAEQYELLAERADARVAAIRGGTRPAKPRPPRLEGSTVAPPKEQASQPVSTMKPYSAADFVREARGRMRSGR